MRRITPLIAVSLLMARPVAKSGPWPRARKPESPDHLARRLHRASGNKVVVETDRP